MTDKLLEQAIDYIENVPDDRDSVGHIDRYAVVADLKERLAQPEQEPVAWPCLIDSADFSENTITLVMQSEDYKVSAGTHYLSTHPPQRTEQDWDALAEKQLASIRRDTKASTEDAMVRAAHKVMAELESQDPAKDAADTLVEVGFWTTPPQRTEPVIDKSAAIRIATALGWTPPKENT